MRPAYCVNLGFFKGTNLKLKSYPSAWTYFNKVSKDGVCRVVLQDSKLVSGLDVISRLIASLNSSERALAFSKQNLAILLNLLLSFASKTQLAIRGLLKFAQLLTAINSVNMFLFILLFAYGAPYANPGVDSVITLREQALQTMRSLPPEAVIPQFTSTPPESGLQPNAPDNEQLLQQAAQVRLSQDDTAQFVMSEEQHRIKNTPNPSELHAADRLIEHSEADMPAVGCADGACDHTAADVSDDMHEGIGQLGTLAGTAEEVNHLQGSSNIPSIFKGTYQECEKYMLGLRDCCTDSGALDWLIHCPWQLQNLQQAKLEHRAVYLGHYKRHRLGTTHYGYCVFPSKLAGIMQIQGRHMQLGIGFGNAKYPDCRGLTAHELSQLDFRRLDISELLQGFIAKKTLPVDHALADTGANHAMILHQQGIAHD